MSESTKKIRRRDCVKLANRIIERCQLPIPRVASIDGIRSNLFTSLLQVLYHRLPEGIIEEPASTEDEISNIQSIINHLALDLINIDLSHISGADVVAGEPRAVYNLLEIFCGLHKYLSATSIGKWNLEESLTETNSELSSRPSSEDSGGHGQEETGWAEDRVGIPAADQSERSPPLSRPASITARISAARVRSSAARVALPPSAGSVVRAASGTDATGRAQSGVVADRVASGASPGRVKSGAESIVRVASSNSAARVSSSASAARMPSNGSAARVPSGSTAARVPSRSSAGRVASRGSASKVPSTGSAVRVPSSGSAIPIPSTDASATKISSAASPGRVSSRASAVRVPSGVPAARSGSGPLPAGSVSAAGEAMASLPPGGGSGPVVRRSVSSGGGSGGAGAAGSSGAGAEPSEGEDVGGKRSAARVDSPASGSGSSDSGPSPLRAPSAGPGGEFAALGRPSAARPSAGGLPGAGGSGAAVQLTGSIDHHHYHHYEESGESSQTADSEEDREEPVYSTVTEERDSRPTIENPDRTRTISEIDSRPQWEHSEDTAEEYPEESAETGPEDTREDYPEDSRDDYLGDTHEDSRLSGPEDYRLSGPEDYRVSDPEDYRVSDPEDYHVSGPEDYRVSGTEDYRDGAAGDSCEDEEEDEGGQVDISRRLSDEIQQMRESSSSEPAPRVSATEQKRSTSSTRREQRDPRASESRAGMPAGGAGCPGGRPRRREVSAPAREECSTSSGGPGVQGRAGAAPPARNVETVAEIRERGGERAVTETTREQAGDRLQKETVRREVRRRVASAARPKHTSYTERATRRSVCSDGVTDWLQSRADDTRLTVDGREADVFEYLRREFPYVHVSAETKRRLLTLYQRQMKYIMSLVEPVQSRKIKIRRQDVLKRQSLLTDILSQQKAHDERFRQISDAKRREARVRNLPRDSKISCLRAQRYVSSFQQQFQSRFAFNKSREELLLRAVFEEMLEIQRSRLRSVRQLEKQSIEEFYDANGYTADLNRLHQHYEANFRELSQLLAGERAELAMAERQRRTLGDRIRREFRDYMEADVRSLNDKIVNSWQPQFRELDADRVRSDLYQANWKFCVQ